MIMEGDPFLLVEGMTIAAFAVGATSGYIYVRSEYPHAKIDARRAIAIATGLSRRECSGSDQTFHLEVRIGAGAYICGEETSLLESLEGGAARCAPSLRCPPYRAFRQADVINNVISLATVPFILG